MSVWTHYHTGHALRTQSLHIRLWFFLRARAMVALLLVDAAGLQLQGLAADWYLSPSIYAA
jgi:hypothetical protein